MKRLLLIALCLLIYPWTSCQSAENVQLARMNPWVAGSVTSGTVTYTDCSQIGAHEFAWFCDYSGDTDKACFGSTPTDGTISGGSVVASGTDPGVISGVSGGNVAKLTSTNFFRWPASGAFTSGEGGGQAEIYLSDSTNDNTIFYASYDKSFPATL